MLQGVDPRHEGAVARMQVNEIGRAVLATLDRVEQHDQRRESPTHAREHQL